jgi:hypothetical protein
MTENITTIPVLDVFSRVLSRPIDKQVREDLDRIIMLIKYGNIPIATNLFFEAKGLLWSGEVAKG